MKKLIILLGFIFAAALPVLPQTSGLPKTMPAGTEMRYNFGGGMSGFADHITVSGNRLLIVKETAKSRKVKKESWAAMISDEDQNRLYQVFVANKFDLMEIAGKEIRVYDAPSQSVFISAESNSYNVSKGAGSPLAGANLKSFENIKDAFEKLQADYKDKLKQVK